MDRILLLKDLIVNDERNKVSDDGSGISLIPSGQWMTWNEVQAVLQQNALNLSVNDIPSDYFHTSEDAVKDKMQGLLSLQPETYARETELGTELNFADAIQTIENVQSLLKNLVHANLSIVPSQYHKKLFDNIQSFHDTLNKINRFSSTQGNPSEERKNILDNLYQNYQTIYNTCQHFQSAQSSAIETAEVKQVVEQTVAQVAAQAKGDLQEINKLKEQAEQALSGITEQASREGVATEARHFTKEAKQHGENACWWLKAAGGAFVALLGAAGYFYCFDTPPDSAGIAWNHFIPRFSILGLLLFVNIILVGIYRAERHNAVVNRHRANALNTFETMTAATLAQDVKDAITLTAASAIYTPQDTGYAKRGGADANKAAEILAALQTNKQN